MLMVVLMGPLQTAGLDLNMRARYLRGVLSSCGGHIGVSLFLVAFLQTGGSTSPRELIFGSFLSF